MGKADSVAPISLMSQISFEPVPCDAKCLGCSSRQETNVPAVPGVSSRASQVVMMEQVLCLGL